MQNSIIQQVVETLRGANNVLITVKNSPSVDELTASIALTLMLNHLNKHATTVFSGQVPSTIEFLQPEMAIETNTDSLRDFIIALDKAKADKLRYKVEDNVVRIFITPYRSSISESDLQFSQGEFNVDVVVALGVLSKEDFDEAVLAHGRILHDATVIAINNQSVPNEVGSISWQDQQASSISEMLASVAELFGPEVVDSQIATALMTGIVAETDRFKNQKTTPQVLSVSSMLMSAGANQQLIAEELEHAATYGPTMRPLTQTTEATDGVLSVGHEDETSGEIHIDDQGNLNSGLTQTGEAPILNIAQDLPQEQSIFGDQNATSSEGSQPGDDNHLQMVDEENSQNHDTEQTDNQDVSHERTFLSPPSNSGGEAGEGHGDPSGLFGSSMHETQSHDDHSNSDTTELQNHKPKRIEPLGDNPQNMIDDNNLDFNLAPPSGDSQNDTPPQQSPPPTAADDSQSATLPSTSIFDEKTDDGQDKTLEDIERAVHSPHLGDAEPVAAESKESSSVDNFMGGMLPPVPSTELPAPTLPQAQEAVAPVSVPPVYTPPPSVPAPSTEIHPEQPVQNKAESVIQIPQTAPAVPPPLMPQAGGGSLPQFYEADGTKSNPFQQ